MSEQDNTIEDEQGRRLSQRKEIPLGCNYIPVVSRVCERGTGGCTVKHADASAVVPEDLRALMRAIQDTLRPYINHAQSCTLGQTNPDGDFCTCGVKAAIAKANKLAESALAARAPQVYCEACEAGYRLNDHVHYDDARDGATWGVCRKYVAECRAARAPQSEGG